MHDSECLEFLDWVLPQLGMRVEGFRRVRRQVCKRLKWRLQDVGIETFERYKAFLTVNQEEWNYLPFLFRITISRFYRDRKVFEALLDQVLPVLITRASQTVTGVLRCWSAGCASGEEVYTLKILERECGKRGLPPVRLEIVASDIDLTMLERAQQGFYQKTSLKELPPDLLDNSFDVEGDHFHVKDTLQKDIQWICQDIRNETPTGPFDLVLCRNLAFTYLDISMQERILDQLASVLREGGALVIGKHESLPETTPHFSSWIEHLRIYRRDSTES